MFPFSMQHSWQLSDKKRERERLNEKKRKKLEKLTSFAILQPSLKIFDLSFFSKDFSAVRLDPGFVFSNVPRKQTLRQTLKRTSQRTW